MRSFRSTLTYGVVAVIVSLCGLLHAHPQAVDGQASTATLWGRVTDAHGTPVAGATVYLTGNHQSLSTQSDSHGEYLVSFAGPGTYSGYAEAAGFDSVFIGPLTLAEKQRKSFDITLPAKASDRGSSVGAPQFFDPPKFTIAGVTDTSNLGGHASGMTGPPESLAKDAGLLAGSATNFAANAALENSARALADGPRSGFRENHAAGTLLLEDGKPREAIAYLSRASQLSPDDYDNSYDLARAYAAVGQYPEARVLVQHLMTQHPSADLHHLLATVEEKSGHPVQAQAQFQQAAHVDPNETNLFDWGLELLTHRAFDPAIEVFREGSRRFPQSARMLNALAAAFYERGSYDEALQSACAAADLFPGESRSYLLLGRMQAADHGQSDAPLIRMRRFANLQPENALANYYYAVALWKRRKGPQDASTAAQVEALLHKSLRLDPSLAKAYFQLGVLYSENNDLPQAISSYEKAVQVDPQLAEAHYRLAQAYAASGQGEKSHKEIVLYKDKTKAQAEAAERERRDVQQFVYTMQSGGVTNQ